MSGKEAMQRIKENAQLAKKNIDDLKNELNIINNEYNAILIKQLQEENVNLVTAIKNAKSKLTQLEVQNGIKQVPLPNQPSSTTGTSQIEAAGKGVPKPAKEKLKTAKETPKPKKEHNELSVDIGRLDLRIGKVESVNLHPDADTLYVLEVNIGEETPRTVCSGLVKHINKEDLKDKTLVILCNLKPAKMRGIMSEAMVMCASSPDGEETLIPPENSVPGDLVHCEGYTRQPDSVLNAKKKIFETVAPSLHTNDKLEACYKKKPLYVPGKGICHSKTLKNVAIK